MCITLCDEFASRSFFFRWSKILTSMRAWWWNRFLFLRVPKTKIKLTNRWLLYRTRRSLLLLFRVPDDFNCDMLTSLVIQSSNNLTEASLSNYLQYFVSLIKRYHWQPNFGYSKSLRIWAIFVTCMRYDRVVFCSNYRYRHRSRCSRPTHRRIFYAPTVPRTKSPSTSRFPYVRIR